MLMKHPSQKPFIIGIAGGTGSGKTTVAKNIIQALPSEHVTNISSDDYYHDQSHLPMSERDKTNYDHPRAFEIELLVKHLKQLKKGHPIQKPIYDFPHHTRSTRIEEVSPTHIIIVEGILVFCFPELLEMFDLKIFVDTDADIRVLRRLKRDTEERGRSFDFVVQQYLDIVRPMHLEFVEPSKREADIIIPEGGENSVALDLLLARVREIVNTP
jgi:uridine kinase